MGDLVIAPLAIHPKTAHCQDIMDTIRELALDMALAIVRLAHSSDPLSLTKKHPALEHGITSRTEIDGVQDGC